MSILHPDSVGKVQKILQFETVFHASASDCTKLTLVFRMVRLFCDACLVGVPFRAMIRLAQS